MNVFAAGVTRERRHPAALREAGAVRRVATLTVVGVLWVLAAYGAMLGWGRVAPADFGADQRFYVEVADRWLETGALYPGQLDGVYRLELMRDNTYPPNALVLFVPFVVLPAILWWLLPAAVIGYGLWRWRPNAFGWALLALVVLWPRTVGAVLFGNTDLWMAALVMAGLLWGWPAVLLAVKPTLAPLALVGVGHRSWWLMAGLAAALVVATLPLWLDYIAALRNARGLGWDYSIGSLPLVLAPILAWVLRTRPSVGRGELASEPE